MFDKAIVGVDDLDAGLEAVALARALGATSLTLATVDGGEGAGTLLGDVRDRAGIEAELLALRSHAPGRALPRAAREHGADLLVLGPAHDDRLAHRDVGRSVLQHAACPVAIGRPGAIAGTPRTVAVGYDGTDQSRAAVDVAAAWAAVHAAALTVLLVWQTPSVPMGVPAPEGLGTDAGRFAQARLDELLERLPDRTAARLVHGRPDAELTRVSQAVDLLVVGSGQPGRLARALLGSTADWCVHHADCPVLVVPRGATETARERVPATARAAAAATATAAPPARDPATAQGG